MGLVWSGKTAGEMSLRLAELLPEAVLRAWSKALDRHALDAHWALGDFEVVYELARLRDAETLAWYAALDPEPGSIRTIAVVEEVLSAVDKGASHLLPILALVPLSDPHIVLQARQLVSPSAALEMALALRLDEDPPVPTTAFLTDAKLGVGYGAILWALAAERFAENGRTDEALQMLACASAESVFHDAAALIARRAAQRLGVPPQIPSTLGDHHADFSALWEAHRRGEQAFARLLDVEPALAPTADVWFRERSLGSPFEVEEGVQRIQEQWEEGLLLDHECRMGIARLRLPLRQALCEYAREEMRLARRKAEHYVDVIAERTRPADCVKAAARQKDLSVLVDAAVAFAGTRAAFVPKRLPRERTMLVGIAEAAQALADVGGRAAVAAEVRRMEVAWGPATSWVDANAMETFRNPMTKATREILACAEGRARHAASPLHSADDANAAGPEACVIAGLAADGHFADALAGALQCLGRKLTPEALAHLIPVAVALEPSSGEAFRAAAKRALERPFPTETSQCG